MLRILLIRIDRLGDVLLTTPIIETIRHHYPQAHIAFMTTPFTQAVVQGNPYLNEVIVYDRRKTHKSVFKTLRFAFTLRKKRFDAAIVFNPNNRANWLIFLAGIPKRIGYSRKTPYLLTDCLKDEKDKEEKSEAFYNEDFLPFIGIAPPQSRNIFCAVSEKDEKKIACFLKIHEIHKKFVVFNVSASCPSKIWPAENFSLLANLIYEKLNLDIVLIGRQIDCERVKELAGIPLTMAAESFNLNELTALFKKAFLHITNDTGPVHLASFVNTPAIVIFGRTLIGLGPKRWAPLKGNNTILQKDIGCHPCLAHYCKIDFDCLKSTKVEEVFHAAKKYQKNPAG